MPRIRTRTARVGEVQLPPRMLVLVPARQRDYEELAAFQSERGNLATTVLPYTKADGLRDWYWGLLQVVADGLGILKDDLHVQLKVKTRFISNWAIGETGPVPILRSIARDIRLGDLREYVDAAIEVIFTEYLPKVRRADVLREVERKFGPRPE